MWQLCIFDYMQARVWRLWIQDIRGKKGKRHIRGVSDISVDWEGHSRSVHTSQWVCFWMKVMWSFEKKTRYSSVFPSKLQWTACAVELSSWWAWALDMGVCGTSGYRLDLETGLLRKLLWKRLPSFEQVETSLTLWRRCWRCGGGVGLLDQKGGSRTRGWIFVG